MMTYSSPDFHVLGDATSLVRGGMVNHEFDTSDICTSDKNRTECPDFDDED
jgi:hypothetical protein